MLQSRLFAKTSKTVPSDAATFSHQLLWKAGFIRRFTSGRWAFLPLGMRVWLKIMNIIQKEMDDIGVNRLVVPTLHPIEVWQATGRDQAFGSEMHILEDHYGQTFALGATAEGMMAELVKMFSPSYKDLPIEIYQFSSKFRDDKRPRGGLLRVREFMMKDAYNFCADEDQFRQGYQKFYESYLKIAKELDLKTTPVLADSGALGGDESHEFMVDSETGDNTYFICSHCHQASNQERCPAYKPDLNPEEKLKDFATIDQPDWVMTMEDNIKHYKEPKWRYLKNVVYKGNDGQIYIASLRGDQEVNESKLTRVLGLNSLEPATDQDLEKLGTRHGYVHSWGIKGVTYVGDEGLLKVKNFIGGQKTNKTDSQNVNYGRDFKYKLIADITNAEDGDTCAACQKGRLREKKAYEWGHVFNLGYFYSKPQKCTYTAKDGQEKPLWMGSYGIGLDRSLALIVESHHDEHGMVWPTSVAPFQIHLLGFDLSDPKVKKQAKDLYQALQEKQIEVLFDDREDITPGEKMADADLIGCPLRVIVSSRALKSGGVELKKRTEKQGKIVTKADIFKYLK